MKPGRNDACPCGSGKKYKKCCGATIPIAPAATTHAGRKCGECIACCGGWVVGNVFGHEMKPGSPCPFVRAGGCSIYARRPTDPCKKFMCGWLVPGSPFPDEFRPDKLGVIFVLIAWRGRRAWVLAPTGRDPDEQLLEQMRRYSTSTGEPHVIRQATKLLCFGSVEFQQDMLIKEQRGELPWS
jgi:hypothetical protein